MKAVAYCLSICLSLFTLPSHAQLTSKKGTIVCKNIAINNFDTLDIQGPVNVYLDETQDHPSLQIMGDPRRVSAVIYSEKNHILFLGTKPIYSSKPGERLTIKVNASPAQIKQIQFNSNARLLGKGIKGSLSINSKGTGQINLYTNQLNLKSLYSDGNQSIILHNIHSSNLNIEAHNSHNIVIQGEVALNTINFTGNGNLLVYWVNSSYLTINANGKGKINLAGVAKTLDINLSHNIRLLGKELRAQQGYIKTENHAQAEINVSHTLRAFAKDKSFIYYSTPVNFLSVYTEGDGMILNKNN